jgi:Zn-dependent metalloprotease
MSLFAPFLLLLVGSSLGFAQDITLFPRSRFSAVTDPSGQTHTRHQMHYRGLRVWGAETIRHSGLAPEPLPAAPRDLELSPSVTIEAAHAAIRSRLGFAGAAADLKTLETVLYPQSDPYLATAPGAPANAAQVFHSPERYALAYLVQATGTPEPAHFLVDGHDGRILERIPLRHTLGPAKGVGRTLYSGEVTLDSTATDAGFQLLDSTRGRGPDGTTEGANQVQDLRHIPGNLDGLPLFQAGTDAGANVWGDGRPEGPDTAAGSATDRTVAADAAFGLQSVWDYFARIHQRNGWDGQGTPVTLKVHFLDASGTYNDNAFWSDSSQDITVSDGQRYWPQADLATIAHEFAHGVNFASAALAYGGESGGLNEASSDIFGAMTVTFVRNGAGTRIGDRNTPWSIEAQRSGPGDSVIVSTLRNMIQPSLDGDSLDEWSPTLTYLDPHFASGPMNRAFYFLSQGATRSPGQPSTADRLAEGMTGIGNDRAAQIWYRALTRYLRPKSTYLNARSAALRAAIDLFGAGSGAHLAVRKAFGAINVGDPEATFDDFEAPTVSAEATILGSTLELTAAASDNDRVSAVMYFIDGFAAGKADSAPYRVTLDASRLLANGSHTLVAKALDPSGNEGASTPVSFTLANPVQQILKDPGLEVRNFINPWHGPISLWPSPAITGFAPHGGQGYVVFNAIGEAIWQDVTIPAGSEAATLRFWAKLSDDPETAQPSLLKVQIRSIPTEIGEQPQVLATPVTLTSQDAWDDWLAYSADLTAFAGRRVELRFVMAAYGPVASFRLDDITLQCGEAPVAVTVAPARAQLLPGASSERLSAAVTDSSDQTVLWTVREAAGELAPGPLFIAPGRPGFYHAVATAEADPGAWAEVSFQVLPRVNATPAEALVQTGRSQTIRLALAAGVEVALAMREGTAAGTAVRLPGTSSVQYTAPDQPGTYHLEISERSDPASTATVTFTVVPAVQVTLSPATRTLAVGSSASYFVTIDGALSLQVQLQILEENGGSIEPDPDDPDRETLRYSAPLVPGSYHLIATSLRNPLAYAAATVTVVSGLAIDPPQPRLLTGAAQVFTATVPGQGTDPAEFTWTAAAGSITAQGLYTAPDTAGDYRISATAGDGSSAMVTVQVRAFDPDGDGQSAGDFGDLAVMADAYGTVTGPEQGAPADLNGDGVVDDRDLKLAKAAFERPGPGTQARNGTRPGS